MEWLSGQGFELRVDATGGIEVMVGEDSYLLASFFSFPGHGIGWNQIPAEQHGADTCWKLVVKRASHSQVELAAEGALYDLQRTVSLQGHRVLVADTLTSKAQEDVGVIVGNRISTRRPPREVLLAGTSGPLKEFEDLRVMAENPTLLVSQAASQLGLVAEDSISRLQFHGADCENGAQFSLDHMALLPGQSRVLRWAIYPMHTADYFDFINRIRRDWNTNFTVPGPWDYIDVTARRSLIENTGEFRAYLERKRISVLPLTPWLDYDNFNYITRKPMERDEYKKYMVGIMRSIKAAAPDIKCLGCMEGNIVAPPYEVQKALYDAFPADIKKRAESGSGIFNDGQMELLKGLDHRWKDCLLTTPEGRYVYELYFRGERMDFPMMAFNVYAAPGNGQEEYWLEQARFMLEEVGVDGIYADQFNLAFCTTTDYINKPGRISQRHSYERWDGLTVDLDPATGNIVRRYTDAGFVSIGARKALIDYVLSRTPTMVVNSHCAAEELQSRAIVRFLESEWFFDPLKLGRGEEPPAHRRMCQGQLDSPVALGYRVERLGEQGVANYAKVVVKSVITLLRHGMLYYNFGTEIPQTGPGSGECGPINHMFPLTPVGLHKGWVEGEERTITAVSGSYRWSGSDKPQVHVFDVTGREKQAKSSLSRTGGGWEVDLELEDWEEVAVME